MTSPAEGSIDILNWLAMTVLDNDDMLDETKAEPVDFDLLKYVDSPESAGSLDDSKIIDDLLLFYKDDEIAGKEEICTQHSPLQEDDELLERAGHCPSSPVCKLHEIDDDFECKVDSILPPSDTYNKDEDVQEPDWLSGWDSLVE